MNAFTHTASVPAPAPLPALRVALSPWQERRAKQLLLEQMSASPLIADIARACSLSRSHFSRAFKKTTGCSPRDWLLQARLQRAQCLLADSTVAIAQVGLDCGFADQSHFTRVFTRCIGTTPFAWRRGINRQDNALPTEFQLHPQVVAVMAAGITQGLPDVVVHRLHRTAEVGREGVVSA